MVKGIAPQCCVLFDSVRDGGCSKYVCMRGDGCAHLLLVESKLTWTDEFASLLAAGSGLGSPERSCGVSDVMILCVETRQDGLQDFHLVHRQDQYSTEGREDDGLPCGQWLAYKEVDGEGEEEGAEQERRARVETSRSVTTQPCYQGGIYAFAPDPRGAPLCAWERTGRAAAGCWGGREHASEGGSGAVLCRMQLYRGPSPQNLVSAAT